MNTPEISEKALGKIEGYKMRLDRDYPNLQYDEFLLVPQGSRIILDDVTSPESPEVMQEAVGVLAGSCSEYSYVYTCDQLAHGLKIRLEGMFGEMTSGDVACVFPGKGARGVKRSLDQQCLVGAEIFQFDIGRRVNDDGVVTGVLTDIKSIRFQSDPRVVLVIDDVIATGYTTAHIKDLIDIPDAEYIAMPLMMLSPVQNPYWQNIQGFEEPCRAGVRGYSRILTPLVYQGQAGIPPVNSLSTLVSNSTKGQVVRQQFIDKHVQDVEAFMRAINELQVSAF